MKLIVLFLLLLVIRTQAVAQLKIEDYLNEVAELSSFSGSVVVAVGDEVLLNRGFGKADFELGVENRSNTVHRIGSLTKQFTSIGILKLFDEIDTISINDQLGEIVSGLPEDWQEITTFQLLTHTSGIPNYFGDLDAVSVEDTYKEIEKVIEMEKNNPRGLRNAPGSEFRYSNFGYVMLGYVIEVVSGQEYFDYLKQAVFTPLSMNQTFYDDPRMLIPDRSEGYKFSDGRLVNDALKDPAGYAAGGILSSTEDMLKWSTALTSDIILDVELKGRMFDPFLENYGMGWTIVKRNGRTRYDHNGGTHGYNSRIVFYPEEKVLITILGNNEDVRSATITCVIEGLIFNEDDPFLSLAYTFDMSAFEKFVGEYSSDTDGKRSIELVDGKPHYVNGKAKFEIVQQTENSFRFAKYREFKIEFSDKKTFTLSTCAVNPRIFERK
ncbi:MAG: serine hydrolase domain-containing protein [Cyclobacteriaceae bacterium]